MAIGGTVPAFFFLFEALNFETGLIPKKHDGRSLVGCKNLLWDERFLVSGSCKNGKYMSLFDR